MAVWAWTATASAGGPRVDVARARVVAGKVSAPSDKGPVTLTLDPELQHDVTTLLTRAHAQEAGAVVIDVKTGRILAWGTVDAEGHDMAGGAYAPPASLFKVVSAAALIDHAHVPLTARQCYVGGERSARIADLRKNGAGDGVRCDTLGTALGYSRNLVVAGLTTRHLDSRALQHTAKLLGYGEEIPVDVQVDKSLVDIPDEQDGLARASAGFGGGRASALTAAYMMAVIARGGRRLPLSLLEAGAPVHAKNDAELTPLMRASTASALTRMLEVTVREGTCAKAFRDGHGSRYLGAMRVAGKTGTLAKGSPTRLYSWFAGFAPANQPEIAIAVVLANDISWWQKGNQVGRDVMRAYFARKRSTGITHPLGQK